MVELHARLKEANIPHAFGGALALAWCMAEARGTLDVDVNLFVGTDQSDLVLAALPPGILITEKNRVQISRDGQTRLKWDDVPVDVFFNTTPFHQAAGGRIRFEKVGDGELPFLDCNDLAVFKAFFNRARDWVDLAAMLHDGTLDVDQVVGVLAEYLGPDDERIARLRTLAPEAWS